MRNLEAVIVGGKEEDGGGRRRTGGASENDFFCQNNMIHIVVCFSRANPQFKANNVQS